MGLLTSPTARSNIFLSGLASSNNLLTSFQERSFPALEAVVPWPSDNDDFAFSEEDDRREKGLGILDRRVNILVRTDEIADDVDEIDAEDGDDDGAGDAEGLDLSVEGVGTSFDVVVEVPADDD
jgi:hypothetical protein